VALIEEWRIIVPQLVAQFEQAIVPQLGGYFDSLPEKNFLPQLGGHFFDTENREDCIHLSLKIFLSYIIRFFLLAAL
jgi:hypothetical protein